MAPVEYLENVVEGLRRAVSRIGDELEEIKKELIKRGIIKEVEK